jgi:hypothetical protein
MYLQIAIAEAQPVRFVIPGVIQEIFLVRIYIVT